MSDLYYTESRRSVELRQRLDQMRLERDRAEGALLAARQDRKQLRSALAGLADTVSVEAEIAVLIPGLSEALDEAVVALEDTS